MVCCNTTKTHYCLLLEVTSRGSEARGEINNCVRSHGAILGFNSRHSVWNVWCYLHKTLCPACLGSCHLGARGYSYCQCAECCTYFNNGSYNLWIHANSLFIYLISTDPKLSIPAKLFVKMSRDLLRFSTEYQQNSCGSLMGNISLGH